MHLTSDIALDFSERRLSADQETFWKGHLEVCNRCAQDVGRWRQLQIDLKRSHLMNAAPRDLQSAMDIFPHQPGEGGSRLRSVLAAIIFDSYVQPAMAGARGTAPEARQIVLRAGQFDIHVKVWGEPDGKQMLGQLLSRDGETLGHAARFHLMQNGARLETTATNEMGEFHFTDVPEGDLSLQLDLPHLTVIGALNLRNAR
jgi:hypothetical protein